MKHAKLMILGASAAQLPIICKAVELGHHVITVDNIPDNIGHQVSHESINCSTVDRLGVLSFAKALGIDGIATFASDVATTTVAFVAEQLKLPGCKLSIAETMSNKAAFRVFQQQQNLPHPNFFISRSLEGEGRHYAMLIPPLIIKPVDTSGSRGITKVDELTFENCQRAFSYAQRFSRSGDVSIEEFIEGTDVSGDGFLVNGQLMAIVTQKYKRGFIPTGHYLPSSLSDKDQARIYAEVSRTCQALGYLEGPIDFDVKISADQIVVIELSPRLGGNGIPELIRRATGVDLMAQTIYYALGQACPFAKVLTVSRSCGSWVFGSDVAGQLQGLVDANVLKDKIPELFEYRFNYQIGHTVPAFEHSGNSLGYALFDCLNERDYSRLVSQLSALMQVHIIESL